MNAHNATKRELINTLVKAKPFLTKKGLANLDTPELCALAESLGVDIFKADDLWEATLAADKAEAFADKMADKMALYAEEGE